VEPLTLTLVEPLTLTLVEPLTLTLVEPSLRRDAAYRQLLHPRRRPDAAGCAAQGMYGSVEFIAQGRWKALRVAR